jgi:hypothetical protein
MPIGALLAPAIGSILGDVGLGGLAGASIFGASVPEVIGSVLGGAGLGAGEAAITGGSPLTGALGGAVGGGISDIAGGALGSALGSPAAGSILGGGLGGVVSSEITGGSPLLGAATGAGGAALGQALGITPGTAPTAAVSPGTVGGIQGGGGASAASTAGAAGGGPGGGGISGAAPAAGGASVDLASAYGLDTGGGGTTGGAGGGSFLQNLFGGAQAAAPTTTTGPGGTLDISGGGGGTTGGGLLSGLMSNPAALLGIGALGYEALQGPPTLPATSQISQAATTAQTHANTLAAYQTSGTLPPGLQSLVDQQVQAAQAQLVSTYGQLGLGSSTMLTDKLNQLKQQRSAEVAQLADQLASQGIQWQQLSNQELSQLLGAQEYGYTQYSNALSNFAKGLAGGGALLTAAAL